MQSAINNITIIFRPFHATNCIMMPNVTKKHFRTRWVHAFSSPVCVRVWRPPELDPPRTLCNRTVQNYLSYAKVVATRSKWEEYLSTSLPLKWGSYVPSYKTRTRCGKCSLHSFRSWPQLLHYLMYLCQPHHLKPLHLFFFNSLHSLVSEIVIPFLANVQIEALETNVTCSPFQTVKPAELEVLLLIRQTRFIGQNSLFNLSFSKKQNQDGIALQSTWAGL